MAFSDGTGTATAVGVHVFASNANTAGTGTATAVASTIIESISTATGTGTAQANTVTIIGTVVMSNGLSTTTGINGTALLSQQQFTGISVFYAGSKKELALVAESDAPIDMGGILKLRTGGVTYAIYLVDVGDLYASPVHVRTTTGTKAVRLRT